MSVMTTTRQSVVIDFLQETDLALADQVMRVAFGTFVGLPDPATFCGDSNWVKNRWKARPEAAFAAKVDGEFAGSNFGSRWGSVGIVGPLTVRQDIWNQGIGQKLMERLMDVFADWGVPFAGLFTFSNSPKHLALYRKFGFHPRFLTAICDKAVTQASDRTRGLHFSELSSKEQQECLKGCRDVADAIYAGLDLSDEIRLIQSEGLGDTVLVEDESGIAAFAVCHTGPQTEAGTGACHIKFAAVRPGKQAEHRFEELLAACESFAVSRGAHHVLAGVNTARTEAYSRILQCGYRMEILGIAMHRPNEEAFNRPGVFVLDDWR